MFVRIEKADLLNGINMATRAVAVNKNKPILSCVLVEVAGEGVQVTGNNLDMSIETASIPANPSMDLADGKVALEARQFSGIINSLPEGEVVISVDEKFVTTITSGKSKFSVPGVDPEEFPVSADITPVGTFTIDTTVLRSMIRQTIFCVSPDDTKPVLTGESFKVVGGLFEICALDMFRIAYTQNETEYDGDDFGVVVPGRTLAEIAKLLPTTKDSKVTMSFDENKVTFEFEGAKVISRLLAGEYLDYSKMFLTDLKSRVTANRADLLGALERAALIGERRTPVMLEMDATSMKISSRTELGSMNEDIDIECDGDDLTIYFNASYIVESLKSMTAERVVLDFSSQMKPCIIREEGNEDCKYLIVPLRPESAARYSASASTPEAAAA